MVCPALVSAQGARRNLFQEAPEVSLDQKERHPASIGSVMARLDLEALGNLDATNQSRLLDLDILKSLGRKGAVARLKRSEAARSGRVAWMGELEGVAWSSVTLVIDRENRAITGSITYPGGVYQIQHTGGGVHSITKLDPSYGADDVVVDPREDAGFDEASKTDTQAGAASSADSGARIDVLVVYTPAARAAAGGATAMQSLIDLAVAETNQSYQNSGITPRVRLVHTAEVSYTEAGFSTDLNRLQGASDGFVDNVHALRDQYGADAVAMIVESSTSCGIAYLGRPAADFAPFAFQVTARNCATGYFTFGHELGHNQGARHDRFVDASNNSPSAYNRGYVSPDSTWRTIMAYGDACGFCTRVQYWSNPDITRNGVAMGIAEGQAWAADNRKTLNNSAPFVANFRQEIASALPAAASLVSPSGTAAVQPTYTWNVVSGATQYQLWVQESGSTPLIQTWHTATAVCGATTCAVTPSTALTAGRTYQWWIQTWNSMGYGPWSSTGTFQVPAAVTLPVAATLQAPSGTLPGTLTPAYTWAKVDNSTWYYLWVSQNGSPVIQSWFTSAAVCGTSTCAVTPSTALASGVAAEWWIQTYNSAGYGPWSAGASFVPFVAPDAATLVSPGGTVSTSTPTYVWNKVNDSTWYYLWVTQNGAPAIQTWFTSASVCGATTCSVTPSTALGLGSATWWVQTYNAAAYGPWSAGSTLTVATADERKD